MEVREANGIEWIHRNKYNTRHKYTGQNLAANVPKRKEKKKILAAKLISSTDCPLKPSFGDARERKRERERARGRERERFNVLIMLRGPCLSLGF